MQINPPSFMNLKIFIDSNDEQLINLYTESAQNHNTQMQTNPNPDAGFDIFTPTRQECSTIAVNKINFQIKTSATITDSSGNTYSTGFFMPPRSSLSSSNLRLANSVGIIDSGYRGNIMGKFDSLYSNYVVEPYSKLVQIIAPNMVPIFVEIVSDLSHLGNPTSRGEGGFGSTNKT